MDTGPSELTEERVREELVRLTSRGFESEDEIVAAAVDCLADEFGSDADVEARVNAIAPHVFAAHDLQAGSWPVPTDCDRLDRAFAALERSGVVARQDFTCCQGCGSGEIHTEIEQARTRGRVDGYTYFHAQDTDAAVEGGGLFLAYGAADEGNDPVAIGHRVVAALRAEGLEADWNGDLKRRIRVPLQWRRRRRRVR